MKFSHFLNQVRCGATLVGVVLATSAFGQTATLEAGKRPAGLSGPSAAASVPAASDGNASTAKTKKAKKADMVNYVPDPAYTPEAMTARYPLQSITTPEQANQAIADVKIARKQVENIFTRDEQICFKKFFANRCIAEAKDRRRLDLAKIRPIQVEAERFKRHAAVVKRDAALEKNRLKAEGDGTGKTPEQKRAENEAAFARKARDREAAQENVIEKRARTERRRQKKAAEAAKRARAMQKASARAGSSSAAASASASAAAPSVPASASGTAASSSK